MTARHWCGPQTTGPTKASSADLVGLWILIELALEQSPVRFDCSLSPCYSSACTGLLLAVLRSHFCSRRGLIDTAGVYIGNRHSRFVFPCLLFTLLDISGSGFCVYLCVELCSAALAVREEQGKSDKINTIVTSLVDLLLVNNSRYAASSLASMVS